MSRKILYYLSAIVCVWLMSGAFAEETVTQATREVAEAEVEPLTMMELIAASGSIGYLIVGLAVISLLLGLKNLIEMSEEELMPSELLNTFQHALSEKRFKDAATCCSKQNCMLSRIVAPAANRRDVNVDRIEEIMREEAEAEAAILYQRLGYLRLISTAAPMLGLLGTVYGMIIAFGKIACNPEVGAKGLATAINISLVTTMLGLVLAVPSMVAFTLLQNRLVKTINNLGFVIGDVLDLIRFSGYKLVLLEEKKC